MRPAELIAGCPAWWNPETIPAQVLKGIEPLKATVNKYLAGQLKEWVGFMFYGPVGVGKTSGALALALPFALAGHYVRFISAPSILRQLKSTWSKASPETTEQVMEHLLLPKLVILDDLGTKEYSPDERELLYGAIIDRHNTGGITWPSGNFDLSTSEGQELFCRMVDGRTLDRYRAHLVRTEKWGASLRRKS